MISLSRVGFDATLHEAIVSAGFVCGPVPVSDKYPAALAPYRPSEKESLCGKRIFSS